MPASMFSLSFLFLVVLISITSAETITFLPAASSTPSLLPPTDNLTARQTYNYFKNSPFSAICPFQENASLLNSGNAATVSFGGESWIVRRSRAKSQAEFCSHFSPNITWSILPTAATAAAYLPNWVSALCDVASSLYSIIFFFFFGGNNPDKALKHGFVAYLTLLYGLAQQTKALYAFIEGYRHPLSASWVNPISSWSGLAAYSLTFIATTNSFWSLGVSFVVVPVGFAMALAYASLRFTSHRLGLGTYTLSDIQAIGNITLEGCVEVLQNPSSAIYTDTNAPRMALMHEIMACLSLALVIVFYLTFVCDFPLPVFGFSLAVTTIVLQLMAVIWTAVVKGHGTPFMLDERCGVVVIAMSAKLGYLDVKVHDHGFVLQVIRDALGL